MSDRLEKLRSKIDSLINKQGAHAGEFFSHLYSVSMFASMLALKRGLDPDIAAACGMLHDIYQVTDGTGAQHAAKGAKIADKMLKQTGLYSDGEIQTITTAIAFHSKKKKQHGPYDELLKDADVMSHFFYNIDAAIQGRDFIRHLNKGNERFESLLLEFGLKKGLQQR